MLRRDKYELELIGTVKEDVMFANFTWTVKEDVMVANFTWEFTLTRAT